MKVSVEKITSAINKISDITSGDKQIPGVLLGLSENLLKVCYSDGHKSFIEHVEVETNETDRMGDIVVDFSLFKRAIDNCQPSGIIVVSDIIIEYKEKVITVSADQLFNVSDNEGNFVEAKKLGQKSMDIAFTEPGSDMRSAILTRMQYETIFESDTIDDEFDKAELLEALGKTSVEKGKLIYLSTKTQTIFVANQAHLTSVPISKVKKLTQEELDTLVAELTENGNYNEEEYKKNVALKENRMHYAAVISQQIAKAIIGIFGKTKSDKIYMHTKDKFCSIFVDDENEHIGVWFEMAQASKAHIGSLERYNSLKYNSYQVSFLREFLTNNIKSALGVTKSTNVVTEFMKNEENNCIDFVIYAGSSQASTSDIYMTALSTVVDPEGTLVGKKFEVSLSVLYDMVSQLKTPNVALDFECGPDGTCIRLSELDIAKETDEYINARKKTEELCASQGIPFDPNTTPTPVELKFEYRERTLMTKQFTMLKK